MDEADIAEWAELERESQRAVDAHQQAALGPTSDGGGLVPEPVHGDDRLWGEPDELLDGWCFMCAKKPHNGIRNPYYAALLERFSKLQHHQSSIELCCSVKQFYEQHFQRAQNNRPWTLRSIRNHLYEHNSCSSDLICGDIIRTLSAQLLLLAETGLRVKDQATGQRFVNDKGMRCYKKTVRMLLHVIDQSEYQ